MLDVSSDQQQSEEDEAPPMASPKPDWRIRERLLLAAKIVGAFLLLPYVLVLLYALPFVRPVSTLMLADLALFRGYDRISSGRSDA